MDIARQTAEQLARKMARQVVRKEQRASWWDGNKDRVNVQRRVNKTIDFVVA